MLRLPKLLVVVLSAMSLQNLSNHGYPQLPIGDQNLNNIREADGTVLIADAKRTKIHQLLRHDSKEKREERNNHQLEEDS